MKGSPTPALPPSGGGSKERLRRIFTVNPGGLREPGVTG
jgi:hypothetical protein